MMAQPLWLALVMAQPLWLALVMAQPLQLVCQIAVLGCYLRLSVLCGGWCRGRRSQLVGRPWIDFNLRLSVLCGGWCRVSRSERV
jgi:hypothetical protein